VNNPSPPSGSSSSLREQREGRKSAGSRPAAVKLQVRWRAPFAKATGGTCRWKAPRIGEAVLVDARAVEAVLALRRRSAMGACGARQGASEAGSPALGVAENATPGKLCLCAELFTSFKYEGGTQVIRPKLETRRQTQLHPGSDCRKVV
jgi:hypothetical protein